MEIFILFDTGQSFVINLDPNIDASTECWCTKIFQMKQQGCNVFISDISLL